MAGRYANMGEDDVMEHADETVEECIQTGEDGGFLDMVDDFDECGEEEGDLSFVSMGGDNEADDRFDEIIGALEEIMMEDEFQVMQNNFAGEHCSTFEGTDENKLIYTDIFSKYTELIEGYVDRRLKEAIKGFSMQHFMEMLAEREEEMQASDVFDMLVSFADFDTFKEIMLAHKKEKEGGGLNLMIRTSMAAIHVDEQEDGEEFPDLELTITPVPSPKKITS